MFDSDKPSSSVGYLDYLTTGEICLWIEGSTTLETGKPSLSRIADEAKRCRWMKAEKTTFPKLGPLERRDKSCRR